jgi:hypothetical protein
MLFPLTSLVRVVVPAPMIFVSLASPFAAMSVAGQVTSSVPGVLETVRVERRNSGDPFAPSPGPGTEECRPGIDLTTPCPCNANQPTNLNAGCNALSPGNVLTGGAVLAQGGTTSLSGMTPGVDTLQLTVMDLPTSASETAGLIQGTAAFSNGVTFGQGLRCVGGTLKRIQNHSPAPGSSTWPAPGDFASTIQARSAQLGDPLVPGSTRHYFVQYRQSLFIAPCTLPNNFNASNALMVAWSPCLAHLIGCLQADGQRIEHAQIPRRLARF